MKQTILILTIALAVSIQCSPDPVSEICNWQAKRNNLISQLSTQGQLLVNQILVDLQEVSYAGMQPVYSYIGATMQKEINQLNQSIDASKFARMAYIYGVGNASAGYGPIRDVCQDAKNVQAVYNSLSKKNQPAALKLIGAIATGYKALLPVFTSINNEQDSNLISQLQKTENMNILTQIAALYAA